MIDIGLRVNSSVLWCEDVSVERGAGHIRISQFGGNPTRRDHHLRRGATL